MNNNIMVSIMCNTYNHEKYIADAIESFLMQKTNFKYEVLIHDDASTDRTAQIIRKYEVKYPEIIKPFYQKENQYSRGVKIRDLNIRRATGKYIAVCEGDDYWTDPYKLQKQIDFLEANSDYSLCVHAATVIDGITKKKIFNIRPSSTDKTFSTEEIIYGGGGIFATNSMVYRKEGTEKLPFFYYNASVGDYPLTIFLSLVGKVYYIDEIMSVYRYAVPGSWTMREFVNIENRVRHFEEISKMLDEINVYTNYKYDLIIQKTKIKNNFYLLIEQGKFREAKRGAFFEYYSSLDKKKKILLHLKSYCPYIFKSLMKIKAVLIDAFN